MMRPWILSILLLLARGFSLHDPLSYNHTSAVVRGETYHFIDEGPREGKMVMILHGFPESWMMYKYQIQLCVGLGYRVIALDMLGYGQSDAPDSLDSYTYASVIADLNALVVENLGVERAIFVSHDWGSMFMWHLASRYPQIVEGLISLCIPIYAPPTVSMTIEELAAVVPQVRYQLSISNSSPSKMNLNIRKFLTSFFSADDDCLLRISVAPIHGDIIDFIQTLNCSSNLVVEPKDLDYMVTQFSISGTRGPTNYYRTYNINRALVNGSGPRNISTPTLYVKAEKDFVSLLATPGNHLFLKNLTEKVVDGGHWISLTHKDEVNLILRDWLLRFVPPPTLISDSIRSLD